MAEKKIHLVANSHIDPVWLWNKYEGTDEVINTFRSACDRLDEYPDLRFSASSMAFYKWVEEFAPDVFERIRRQVKAGRWEITGGWLIEPDCNLPMEASFRKSAEISKAFVSDRFGIDIDVAYCPDSFGHAASLPTILAADGFKYYLFCRPSNYEKTDLPDDLFYWEHGSSRVLCYRLKYHYLTLSPKHMEEAMADEDYVKRGLACHFFGVGDHGGGPTKVEIERMIGLRARLTTRSLEFSTCREFFREAEKLPDIPTYSGDLHYHAIGCYSVNREIKQSVRSSEQGLCYAGRVLAADSRDAAVLDPLWERTIFNQFHDILPGSCSPEAAGQAVDELRGVRSAVSDMAYRAVKKMSAQVPVECEQGEFRIYNSLPEPVTAPFHIESFMYYRPGAAFKDSTGRRLTIQEITPSVYCANRRWMFVDTIGAGELRRYYFDSDDPVEREGSFRYGAGSRAEGSHYAVQAPGVIEDGAQLASVSLQVIGDQSDTWSHGIRGFGDSVGAFGEVSSAVAGREVASFLLSRLEYGKSSAELLWTAYRELPYVDLDVYVRWNEEQSVLKMVIDQPEGFGSVLAAGPGAAIEKRTDGAEEPLHGWLRAGQLGLVQDGAFAFDRKGKEIRVTLVRSSVYGYDGNWTVDRQGPVSHTDIGEHSFRFRFVRAGDLAAEDLDGMHAALIEPFKVLRENG